MKGALVRIGFDQAYGGWNAPVDPASGEFVYLPIPESNKTQFQAGLERRFDEVLPQLEEFCECHQMVTPTLPSSAMHLDPDFHHLTYGDDGSRRGAGLKTLSSGDFIAFYAGLKPISSCGHKVLYALIGFYEVERVVPIAEVQPRRWHENAHTRKLKHYSHDIVIQAKRQRSGRLQRCIPIGERRSGAYRVRNDLLKTWGGLSVKDGFIQRSAVPPFFLKPEQFRKWLRTQNVSLVGRNN
jgi:putative DNA base modification enzyme with NMAD domain